MSHDFPKLMAMNEICSRGEHVQCWFDCRIEMFVYLLNRRRSQKAQTETKATTEKALVWDEQTIESLVSQWPEAIRINIWWYVGSDVRHRWRVGKLIKLQLWISRRFSFKIDIQCLIGFSGWADWILIFASSMNLVGIVYAKSFFPIFRRNHVIADRRTCQSHFSLTTSVTAATAHGSAIDWKRRLISSSLIAKYYRW